MNIAYKYLLYACMATCFMQVGCTDEVHLNRDDGEEDVVVENYLRLTISSPEAKLLTRSNPTGGENGDGYEPGQDYETRIDDLMLLFYQGTDGVNSPASTPIDKIMYLDRNAMEGDNRTEPVLVGLPGGWYDLLVITNTGNIRSQLQGMTLGGVRDYLQKRAWTENGGKYSRFVMASDGHLDTQVYICGENTIDNPASATVEVERHAARIDYQLVHKYYDVTDKTAGEAQVSITGALIVNKLDAGSYMLKRVIGAASDGSYGAENTLEYLGLELPEWGDHQTNYVLDPWSRKKTLANVDRRVFNPEQPSGSGQPLASLYENYFTSYGTSVSNWKFAPGLGERVGDWYRVGYTKENTVAKAEQSPYINTGVVFKASYGPKKCIVYDPVSGKAIERTGLDGAPFTFFAYKGVIYNSAEAVMAAFTGNGTNVVGYDFAGKTWGDVEKLTKELKENDPVGYRRFLTQKAKGKTATDRLTEAEAYQLSWNNYMYVTFGYSLGTNGTSIINLNGKDTRRLLARYGLHTYADGVCYYTHWIRHSNNNDPSKGIMEYAIVRNNVYKLRLSDIYGLGHDIPYEPPFDPEPVDPTPPGPDDPDNPPTPPGPDDPDNPPTPPGPDDPDNPPTPPGPDDPDDPDTDPLIQIEVVVKPWLIIDPETFYF